MRARTPGNVRERVLSVTSPDRISRCQEHQSKLWLQRPCPSQLLPAWALDMPCHKQAGAGFRPAPGQCDLVLEHFASTSSQHTPTPLTGAPFARTCLLWARAIYHGYGEPVTITRRTDLLHAEPTSRPCLHLDSSRSPPGGIVCVQNRLPAHKTGNDRSKANGLVRRFDLDADRAAW